MILAIYLFCFILGSSNRSNSMKCFISESCWDMMTFPMGKNYRLTHQLLWFSIANNIGCVKQRLAKQNLNYLEDYFCANIYQDAQFNFINNVNQDLFLEQSLLCSIVGYKDFLRFDWLNTILTWQQADYGCFSDASEILRFRHRIRRHLLFENEMNHRYYLYNLKLNIIYY